MKFMVYDANGFRQKDIDAKDYAEALVIAKRSIHAPMIESYDDFKNRTSPQNEQT